MADGNREEALSKLETLRDLAVFTIRERFNDISDAFQASLTNRAHYWPMQDHVGKLVHQLQNVRQTFLNWMANHPDVLDADLVEFQNQEVVFLNDPMMGHAWIIDKGDRVLNLMVYELDLIIGVLPEVGDADVEVIYELASDAIEVIDGLVDEGAELMVRVHDDQASDKTSTSNSSTPGSSP